MMRFTFCLLLMVSTSSPAVMYRWTDDQGNVHFSDESRPGAEPYDPGKPSVVEALPTARPSSAAAAATDQEKRSTHYRHFEILRPAPKATLRGNPGAVDVQMGVEPPLRPGDRISVVLDGRPASDGPTRGGSFRFTDVERGEHTITARIVARDGDVVAEADKVTFYMHRPSVKLPANPN